MRVSLNWLKELVDIDMPPEGEEFGRILTIVEMRANYCDTSIKPIGREKRLSLHLATPTDCSTDAVRNAIALSDVIGNAIACLIVYS